jgi:hypothetical protein
MVMEFKNFEEVTLPDVVSTETTCVIPH